MDRTPLPAPQFSSPLLELSFLKALVQRPAGQSRNGICHINSPDKEFLAYEIKADTILLSYSRFSQHATNNCLLLHLPGKFSFCFQFFSFMIINLCLCILRLLCGGCFRRKVLEVRFLWLHCFTFDEWRRGNWSPLYSKCENPLNISRILLSCRG